MYQMTTFAIIVLAILVLVALFSLAVALYSFGVNLPKWLRNIVGVFFIMYSVFAIIGFMFMNVVSFTPASIVLVVLTLVLGIYMLLKAGLPRRLKIAIGIIACVLVLINILGCFAVPAIYGSATLNVGINGL